MAGSVDSATIMWGAGQIAERDGISKQAVSKTIAKLIREHKIPHDLDGRGRVTKVSLAHYDHHRGMFGNSEKSQAKEPVAEQDMPLSASRDEALRQTAWLALDRQRIEHAEELGLLVRADKVAEGLLIAARTIQSEIGRLQNKADEVALAVSKEGTSGARLALRQIGVELSNRIADALAEVARGAPAEDERADETAE